MILIMGLLTDHYNCTGEQNKIFKKVNKVVMNNIVGIFFFTFIEEQEKYSCGKHYLQHYDRRGKLY